LDTRRLEAFIKVVDLGSVTRAAKLLNVAQPALSQQIASLESDFKRQLLVRSARGVKPTEAGQILYRYAKSIQRQIDEARRSILDNKPELTGNVTIGLAPLSSATLLATPLLMKVRERFPGIVLHIYDSFGIVLSEMMLKGSMDMAVLYGDRPVTGLDYKPLMREPFFLVAPRSMFSERPQSESVSAAEIVQFDLVLPYRESFLRQAIEKVCRGRTPSAHCRRDPFAIDPLVRDCSRNGCYRAATLHCERTAEPGRILCPADRCAGSVAANVALHFRQCGFVRCRVRRLQDLARDNCRDLGQFGRVAAFR